MIQLCCAVTMLWLWFLNDAWKQPHTYIQFQSLILKLFDSFFFSHFVLFFFFMGKWTQIKQEEDNKKWREWLPSRMNDEPWSYYTEHMHSDGCIVISTFVYDPWFYANFSCSSYFYPRKHANGAVQLWNP